MDPTKPYLKAPAAIHKDSPSTVINHLKLLNTLIGRIASTPQLLEAPIVQVVDYHLRCLSSESKRGWTPSSHFRNLTAMEGALNKLSVYALNCQMSINLNRDKVWANSKAAWDLLQKEHQQINLPAATAADIQAAVDAQTDKEMRALLMLLWLLAARKGDATHLKTESVQLLPEGRLKVFVQEGKGVKARKGKYHVVSECPPQWRQELAAFLQSRKGQTHLFRPSLSHTNEINQALAAADPTLTCRAVRRGAAQAMAMDPNVAPEVIMTITGHKCLETLHRYLGWNKVNEKMHLAAQVAARNLAPPPLLDLSESM